MKKQYLCSVLMPKVHLCLCVTCVHEEIPVRELALPMHRTWHDKSQNTPVLSTSEVLLSVHLKPKADAARRILGGGLLLPF
jgi:hypothetical protein